VTEQVTEVFRLLGFPSIRRPNGACKVFGNSFIIAYLGSRRVDEKSVVSMGEC
jgi:hypothetical protein